MEDEQQVVHAFRSAVICATKQAITGRTPGGMRLKRLGGSREREKEGGEKKRTMSAPRDAAATLLEYLYR